MAAPSHPAVTVTNIKNYILILLETEDSQYTSWAELFKIHCRAFQVLDHILPPAPSPATKEKDPKADEQWSRIDAIVLQWIYGTISKDLLITILSSGTTAAAAWNAIENIFIDSKPARALHLQQKFANVKLQNFPNMAAYCQEVKNLSDQLTNVEAPVDNQRLVLQLISGLSDQYDSIATLLQQSTLLPYFYTARSKLCLEETRKSLHNPPETALTASITTLAAHVTGTTTADQRDSGPPSQSQQQRSSGRGQSDQSYRGRGRGGRGKGRGCGRGRGFSYSPHPPWYSWTAPPWPTPPVPYPTAPQQRYLTARPPDAGILGSSPAQAYASEASYTPTNIEQAMNTMTLNPDPNWYAVTGATNHMANTTRKISTYVHNSGPNRIVFGNGSHIPIHGSGHTTLPPPFPPLKLYNILHAPHLIKNLLSIHRLTTDNSVAVEFDHFGLLVKDY